MKKFPLLLLMFALLLQSACGFAQGSYCTLEELRQEAQSGWHQSYEAHGRTITVDLDSITIPDVQQLPVYRVSSAEPIAQERLAGLNVVCNNAYINAGAGKLRDTTEGFGYFGGFDYSLNRYGLQGNDPLDMLMEGSDMARGVCPDIAA